MADLRLGPFERGAEAISVERLEQVIQGMHLERLEGIAIVGGDEDHDWHGRVRQAGENAEAVQERHLHVEEHEVGLESPQFGERLLAVAALAEDIDVRVALQQVADTLPRQRLVVHDQCANLHSFSVPNLSSIFLPSIFLPVSNSSSSKGTVTLTCSP